jgi:hypothetical protein
MIMKNRLLSLKNSARRGFLAIGSNRETLLRLSEEKFGLL